MGIEGRRGWRLRTPAAGRGFKALGEVQSDPSGVLVAARSEVSDALVDVRVLAPALTADPALMRRLGGDMSVLRDLRHTNLVSVMDYDKRAGAVVCESVPGSTVAELLDARGALELPASLVVLDDCAAGLEALHNVGVLHRNVTPHSVVVETTGAVLLRDAGLATAPSSGLLPEQRAHLAPEVAAGAAYTRSADLYAATAVFVECIGGRASKTGVRSDLRPLLAAGMAANPSERSPSITDFRRKLDDYARGSVGESWRREGRAQLAAAASGQATRTIRLALAPEATDDGAGDAKATVALLHSERPSNTRWLIAAGTVAFAALLVATFAMRVYGASNPLRYSVPTGLVPPPDISRFFPPIGVQSPAATPANPAPTGSAPGAPIIPGPITPSTPGSTPGSQRSTPGATPIPNPALGSQTVRFVSSPPAGARYGGSYVVSATGGASGNPVVFSTAPSSAGCTKSGANTFSFTGVGTCAIIAYQAGNSRYNPAQSAQSFTIAQSSQTIAIITSPSNPTYGGSYTVQAHAASGLPVTFSADASSVACGVSSSGAVSFTAAGTCVIDANQGGNADYFAAPMTQQTFDVAQASQTISFTSPNPCPCATQTTYTVTANASSGLSVSFNIASSSTPGACTISGNVVTINGGQGFPGTCVIDAFQAGNQNYAAAPVQQQDLTVS